MAGKIIFVRPPFQAQARAMPLRLLSLAASGLTNKQIVERLFLSHRTAGGHLHQALPELGVTTRAALRDALASVPGAAPALNA